jgi:hypothetical protein
MRAMSPGRCPAACLVLLVLVLLLLSKAVSTVWISEE